MKNVLILNAHQVWEGFAPGKLNQSFVDMASSLLTEKGYTVKTTLINDQNYQVKDEIEKHLWADYIIIQTPMYWMQTPWIFKKYMDEVYTAAMGGELCNGDGRTRKDPSKQYGSGGTAQDKKYMLSVTANAPREAFGDVNQTFFGGKTVDDVYFPLHLNYKFFGMEALPTFSAHDVLKNPQIEEDFARFKKHINDNF